jgi:hypothetical protein
MFGTADQGGAVADETQLTAIVLGRLCDDGTQHSEAI